jgi:hypothetical protein
MIFIPQSLVRDLLRPRTARSLVWNRSTAARVKQMRLAKR